MLHSGLAKLMGYFETSFLVASRWGALKQPQMRVEFHRQIHHLGIGALPVALSLAFLTGAITVTQITMLLKGQGETGQRLIFFLLLFELAPMLSALVVVARSSSAIASELAVMHLHGEFTALRRMGVPAASFLFVPRIAALTLSLPALTAIFQGVSGFSGCMGYALWQQQPLDQTVGNFLEFSDAWLFLASLLKSALTGFVVGTIACYHGSSEPRSAQAISDAAVHAVGSGLVAVFVIDMAFAAGAMGLT